MTYIIEPRINRFDRKQYSEPITKMLTKDSALPLVETLITIGLNRKTATYDKIVFLFGSDFL